MKAFNKTRNVLIADRLEWAGTSETRKKGLLGRASFERGEGIYIVPTQWIHMIGMKFLSASRETRGITPRMWSANIALIPAANPIPMACATRMLGKAKIDVDSRVHTLSGVDSSHRKNGSIADGLRR